MWYTFLPNLNENFTKLKWAIHSFCKKLCIFLTTITKKKIIFFLEDRILFRKNNFQVIKLYYMYQLYWTVWLVNMCTEFYSFPFSNSKGIFFSVSGGMVSKTFFAILKLMKDNSEGKCLLPEFISWSVCCQNVPIAPILQQIHN